MTFPGEGTNETVRLPACRRLGRLGVTFLSNHTIVEAGPAGVVARDDYSGRLTTLVDVDTVVTSLLPVSNEVLAAQLAARGIEHHVIGDARAPRTVLEATQEGYDVANLLGRVSQRSSVATTA
jgi:hypothetical protein